MILPTKLYVLTIFAAIYATLIYISENLYTKLPLHLDLDKLDSRFQPVLVAFRCPLFIDLKFSAKSENCNFLTAGKISWMVGSAVGRHSLFFMKVKRLSTSGVATLMYRLRGNGEGWVVLWTALWICLMYHILNNWSHCCTDPSSTSEFDCFIRKCVKLNNIPQQLLEMLISCCWRKVLNLDKRRQCSLVTCTYRLAYCGCSHDSFNLKPNLSTISMQKQDNKQKKSRILDKR